MDQSLVNIINDSLNSELIDMIFSNPPKTADVSKVKLRPILLKDKLVYQASEYRGKQIFHSNYTKDELILKIEDWTKDFMKQILIRTKDKEITVLISKKGKVTIKSKEIALTKGTEINLNHNKKKAYILTEGNPVPFLIDLGVMTNEGKIINAKYDKFKQINRFLEFIEDILPNLNKDSELTILDFGCGKSYLTFAMYYYLKELKGYNIQIIGLDLKKDVIEKCNLLAKSYGYEQLHFLEGDIASYNGVNKVDMVVTLHACDTATDYALYKAYKWDADVILSVPCCQHELNAQMSCDILKPILHYGLIKERMAALATDALRAELLEVIGYKAQILEFIDMEHTPKNILIRAVKKSIIKEEILSEELSYKNASLNKAIESKLTSYKECIDFLGVEPVLYNLIKDIKSLQ